MIRSPAAPKQLLVFAAIDASRKFDKWNAVKQSLPEEMRPYFNITEVYMAKHAAIEAVVELMGPVPTEEGLETSQPTSPSSDPT